MNHHCTDCRQPIPAGLAHVRTNLREQAVLCGSCLELRRAAAMPAAPVVPVRRRGGSLRERLAAAAVERASA